MTVLSEAQKAKLKDLTSFSTFSDREKWLYVYGKYAWSRYRTLRLLFALSLTGNLVQCAASWF